MRLRNKVALITGAARGQGAAEAVLFAREGAKVVVADVVTDPGRKTAAKVNDSGGDARYVDLDVTSEGAWIAAIAETVDLFGALHILVNNAGILRRSTVENTTVGEWDEVLDVNARGVFLGIKHAIKPMRRNGGGSIVNISSVAGFVGNNRDSAYTASKGAVRLLTKSAAIQLAPDGIRVNSIHPGVIETEMIADVLDDPEKMQDRLSGIPLGRLGTVDDVARAALFLASGEASYVTGTELVVDGGQIAQ